MTLLNGNVAVFTKDKIYPVRLPFRDGSNIDKTELYFNDGESDESDDGF